MMAGCTDAVQCRSHVLVCWPHWRPDDPIYKKIRFRSYPGLCEIHPPRALLRRPTLAHFWAASAAAQTLPRHVASRLEAGTIWVNTYRTMSPQSPREGFKTSGVGVEHGIESIREYTRVKSVWINTDESPLADPFIMRS